MSLGGPGMPLKQTMFFSKRLGRVLGALGVLVLWGGPWVGPGKSKCCYCVVISNVLGMRGFALICCLFRDRFFFYKEGKQALILVLIFGGANVDISLAFVFVF